MLGVGSEAPRAEIERAAQRLLAELAVGRSSALTYETPFGPRPRTEALVRAAVAELRDPKKRLVHELWARVELGESSAPATPSWPDALERLGLGRGPER